MCGLVSLFFHWESYLTTGGSDFMLLETLCLESQLWSTSYSPRSLPCLKDAPPHFFSLSQFFFWPAFHFSLPTWSSLPLFFPLHLPLRSLPSSTPDVYCIFHSEWDSSIHFYFHFYTKKEKSCNSFVPPFSSHCASLWRSNACWLISGLIFNMLCLLWDYGFFPNWPFPGVCKQLSLPTILYQAIL